MAPASNTPTVASDVVNRSMARAMLTLSSLMRMSVKSRTIAISGKKREFTDQNIPSTSAQVRNPRMYGRGKSRVAKEVSSNACRLGGVPQDRNDFVNPQHQHD